MARPSGEKTRCDGTWTEAKFKSFIKNQLRSATIKWAPIQNCKKSARVSRGIYLCAGCKQEVPATAVDHTSGVRKHNVYVDHVKPIVPPETGWDNWDGVIDRMFCDSNNLELLCKECHDEKSAEERKIAKQRRALEKENE